MVVKGRDLRRRGGEVGRLGRLAGEWWRLWWRREGERSAGGLGRGGDGRRRPDLRGTQPEWTPARGEVVGRTAGMRRLWWTAREEEGSAVVVGTETNSGKVTTIRGRNCEGELLRWAKEAGEE